MATASVIYPPQLAAETGADGWAIPCGRLLNLIADRREDERPDRAFKLRQMAGDHFSGWEGQVVPEVRSHREWNALQQGMDGLEEADAILAASGAHVEFESARQHLNFLRVISFDEQMGVIYDNHLTVSYPDDAVEPGEAGQLDISVGDAMYLVADDEEAKGNGGLATQLRYIADRYYFETNTGIVVQLPEGRNILLSEFTQLSAFEVGNISRSPDGITSLPGSYRINSWQDECAHSVHRDALEFTLHLFWAEDEDGDKLENCLVASDAIWLSASVDRDWQPKN